LSFVKRILVFWLEEVMSQDSDHIYRLAGGEVWRKGQLGTSVAGLGQNTEETASKRRREEGRGG
jgi:hypothetical protein